ncbi:nitroreductase [Candidatus Pacearchaeota archaeon CG10_big_fil_rev_8_21_14_0_10_32_42]|nr:MAG: nitroreductase [Candidatus Pacearchaeota archaeon CG10_big_fil_rev_8_21_14_0_10_32_42]
MELDKAIKSRKSIRKFSPKKPDWRDIIESIHSAQYAPMAGGLFHLKFVIVDDEKIIQEIAKWSEQVFIAEAKYVVVAVSDSGIVTTPFPKRGEHFSTQQAGAAIQNFLLSLTDFGLSTCWIGHFNEEKVGKILKIPDGYTIEALFPIGYANEKPRMNKPKADIYHILYFNEWYNDRMKRIEKIESRGPEGY